MLKQTMYPLPPLSQYHLSDQQLHLTAHENMHQMSDYICQVRNEESYRLHGS